jgi:hypothetical protein
LRGFERYQDVSPRVRSIEHSSRAPQVVLAFSRLLTVPGLAGQTESGKIRPGAISLRFSGLRVFIALHGVRWGDERLFEATINLAQFPEDQNKDNHDYEQQEWDVHLFISSSEELAHWAVH